MSVWVTDDEWLLSIQSKYECFGAIQAIKDWKTIQCLPDLDSTTLVTFLSAHNFNPHLRSDTTGKENFKKTKAVRQAKESYVNSIGIYQSQSNNEKWRIKSSVRASMKTRSYWSLIVLTISSDPKIQLTDASCQCPAG